MCVQTHMCYEHESVPARAKSGPWQSSLKAGLPRMRFLDSETTATIGAGAAEHPIVWFLHYETTALTGPGAAEHPKGALSKLRNHRHKCAHTGKLK